MRRKMFQSKKTTKVSSPMLTLIVDMQKLPRGKKQKMKRKQKKYAGQDEEDRKLAMELIGAEEMQFNSKKNKNQDDAYYKKDEEKSKQQQSQKQNKQKQQNKPKGKLNQSYFEI